MANPGSSVAHGIATNFRAYITYSKGTETNTNTPYTFTLIDRIINNQSQVNSVSKNSKSYTFKALGSTQASGSEPSSATSVSSNGTKDYTIATKTVSFPRGTSSSSQTVTLTIRSEVSGNTSTATVTLTIPERPYHTISYNANGGSGSIASKKKHYGINITLSDGAGLTRTGFELLGWNTAADGTGTHYDLGATYSVNSTTNLTLYAEWKPTAKVKVNGAWKSGAIFIKAGGSWRTPKSIFAKINGFWKQV